MTCKLLRQLRRDRYHSAEKYHYPNLLSQVDADTMTSIAAYLGPTAVANLRLATHVSLVTQSLVHEKVEDILQHWLALTEQEEMTYTQLMYEIAAVQDVHGNTALHRTALRMAELAPNALESTADLLNASRKCLLIREFMMDASQRNRHGQTAEDILKQAASTMTLTGRSWDAWRELEVVGDVIRLRHDQLTTLQNVGICSDGVAYVLEREEEYSQLTPVFMAAMKQRHRKFALSLLTAQIGQVSTANGKVTPGALSPDLAETVTLSLGLCQSDMLGSTAIQIARQEGFYDIERLLLLISNTRHVHKVQHLWPPSQSGSLSCSPHVATASACSCQQYKLPSLINKTHKTAHMPKVNFSSSSLPTSLAMASSQLPPRYESECDSDDSWEFVEIADCL